MPQYLAPGVYVEEVPSASAPIAGVGTSTAGFIGILPDGWTAGRVEAEEVGRGDADTVTFDLDRYPVDETADTFEVRVNNVEVAAATLENDDTARVSRVNFPEAAPPAAGSTITATYFVTPPAAGEPVLCTTWNDFTKAFGDFTANDDTAARRHRNLAHSVYGFFQNGGSRCFVARIAEPGADVTPNVQPVLDRFEAIDEIALVAAPGLTDIPEVQVAITAHCRVRTGDRFAIFDTAQNTSLTALAADGPAMPDNNDYAALYYPWIEVSDPGLGRRVFVPPSGHVAGVYARVDTERGVHKSPGNVPVYGAVGLRFNVSKAQQNGLNPQGVNVIRDVNGNLRVYGARTIGGDANLEWKYVNIRRLFLFLRESIDEGTQWTVFEPNTPALWAKITLNVSAFLRNVWRDGALFGDTPEQAFYVKCDAETNPREVRDAGRVVTEIGVAVVQPAEFVIFRISQWTGPGG